MSTRWGRGYVGKVPGAGAAAGKQEEDSWLPASQQPPPPLSSLLPGEVPTLAVRGTVPGGTLLAMHCPHITVLGWGKKCNTKLPANPAESPTIGPEMKNQRNSILGYSRIWVFYLPAFCTPLLLLQSGGGHPPPTTDHSQPRPCPLGTFVSPLAAGPPHLALCGSLSSRADQSFNFIQASESQSNLIFIDSEAFSW